MCNFKALNPSTLITVYFFCFVLYSCDAQQKKIDTCKSNYNKASKAFYSYYQNTDQSVLINALSYLENPINCEETRFEAVQLKINILALLKEYELGIKFVDSLNLADFKLKYKQKMYHNYFNGIYYESKSDSIQRNKYFLQAIEPVQDYIKDNQIKNKFNEESFSDLFFLKKQITTLDVLNTEIDSFKLQFSDKADFFETLRITFTPSEGKSSPIDNN